MTYILPLLYSPLCASSLWSFIVNKQEGGKTGLIPADITNSDMFFGISEHG